MTEYWNVILFFLVDVLLKAAGDAPIMKKKKWAVDANKTVSYLVEFIRRYIKCDPSDSLVSVVYNIYVIPSTGISLLGIKIQ